MLAQHAHVCLELEKNLKSIDNSSNYIQYANELWSSIVFLSKTIAAKARATFTDLKTDSSNELVDAMSAIYLLDETDTKQLFGEFIAERIPVIKSALDIENTDKSLIFPSNLIIKLILFF